MKKTVFLTLLSLLLAMSVTTYAFQPAGTAGKGKGPGGSTLVRSMAPGAGTTPAAIGLSGKRNAFLEEKRLQKERARAAMTERERDVYEGAAAAMLATSPSAVVLDAGAVKLKNRVLKFDTPPVIRGGRTLVPVRALTEGLGATVRYTTEGGIGLVTISRTTTMSAIGPDGATTTSAPAITVVLTIGSTKVTVTENGITRTIDLADTKPGIAHGRTYVPLRFLAEIFGLRVSHDGATGTIDIEEKDGDESAAEGDGTAADTGATTQAASTTTAGGIAAPTTTVGGITAPTTTEGGITAPTTTEGGITAPATTEGGSEADAGGTAATL